MTIKYTLANRDLWYGDCDYKSRDGVMSEIPPLDFLMAAPPLVIDEESRENIDILKNMIINGEALDPVALYDGAGKAHDGRHRAQACIELGVKLMPVLLFGDQRNRYLNEAGADIIADHFSSPNS